TVKDGHDQLHQAHENYMFLADDLAAPSADLDQAAKALAARDPNGVADRARDQAFTRFTADRAIPAAKRAIDDGHPALIVLWQHNPDLTQHLAGLGTLQASEALSASDQNLATLQAALSASGLTDRADMMVVSDHGFATIRERVWLAGLL